MDSRKIGSLDVSLVGIGCDNFGWHINETDTKAVVETCLDEGINFFDTANCYADGQSEEFLGAALKGRRQEAIIATKFGHKMGDEPASANPDYIPLAVEASLKRLGVDYIDLYQLHLPDPNTPIGDTLTALDRLVQAGKIREIGCSNFSAEQICDAEQAVAEGAARFVSVQNYYNLIHREPEADVLPACAGAKISFLPFFPLESGLLTGKYRKGKPYPESGRWNHPFFKGALSKATIDTHLERVEALAQFSESRGFGLLDLAFSWLLAHPEVASVIAGARTPEQVRANAKAMRWRLTESDLVQVDQILT